MWWFVSPRIAFGEGALTSLLISGISDSKASTGDTTVPDNEIASSVNQTDSPLSANATITITMRTPPLPDE